MSYKYTKKSDFYLGIPHLEFFFLKLRKGIHLKEYTVNNKPSGGIIRFLDKFTDKEPKFSQFGTL